jgi:hypothetical protein
MIVRVFRNDVEEPLLNLPEDEYLDVESLVLSLWRVSYSSSLEFRLHNECLVCFFQDMPVNIPQTYMDQMITIGKKEYYLVGDKLPVKVDWAERLEILFDDDEYEDDHP